MTGVDTVAFYTTMRRKASQRALGSLPPRPRASVVTFSFETPSEEEPRRGSLHACTLHACALCQKPLSTSSDVYMYRGDTPFCSEECRQEQIELDEAQERETSYRRRRHHHRATRVRQLPPPAQHSLHERHPDAVVAS